MPWKAREAGANVMPIYSLGLRPQKSRLECKKLNYKPLFMPFPPLLWMRYWKLAGPVL